MVGYARKRVLVTGGTGFIGGRLAERLSFEQGAEVVILLRDWRRAVWCGRMPAIMVEGDVTKPQSVAKAMAGCQFVFHCAMSGGDAEACRRINRNGTLNLLAAAAQAGVQRVVYLSTIAVHGPNPPENADESAPMVSLGDAYGDSKIAAEQAIADFRRQHRLGIVTLRPTFVWGPRSAWFTVEPVQQIRARTWRLVDRGLGTCHAVYIDNLVDAMLLAGVAPGVEGESFLITDGQPCTWADFFMDYARMVGVHSLPSISPARAASRPWRWLDRSLMRLHDTLGGWTPATEPLRLCSRGTRYVIRRLRRWFGAPPFCDWDLAMYGRCGQLNISKARERLGYMPRIGRAEGMRQVEMWLRDQNLIP